MMFAGFLFVLVLCGLTLKVFLRNYRRALYEMVDGKQFRELLFQLIHDAEYPPEMTLYVRRLTPKLEDLGFSVMNDYLLADSPRRGYGRYLLSRDRKVFVVIYQLWTALAPEVRCFAMVSVLNDGTYVQSNPVPRPLDVPDPPPHLVMEYLSRANARALFDHHCQAVAREEAARGAMALPLNPDQVIKASRFGHRQSWRYLESLGLASMPDTSEENFA